MLLVGLHVDWLSAHRQTDRQADTQVKTVYPPVSVRSLVDAYARGPAFSWVHCQHDSSTDAQFTLSLPLAFMQQQQKVSALGKPDRLADDVDQFIARTD